MTFLPTPPSGNGNSQRESNLIPQPVYTYLSESTFLSKLTPPDKESFKVNSEFKSLDHVSTS